MKKFIILSMIVIGSLATGSAYSQVHIDAQIGERDYPGYTYYTYPAWRGHDHDRAYFEHYHTRFRREHRTYFHGRTFDHDRWERNHHRH